jgi:hypothetical protein
VAEVARISAGGVGGGAEKHLAFELLAGGMAGAEGGEFGGDVFAEGFTGEAKAADGVVGIGGGEGAKKGAGVFRGAMGDDEGRGVWIDGQAVAGLAMEGKLHRLHERAGGIGHVTGAAVEGVAVEKGDIRTGKVQSVVKGEGVGIMVAG